MKLYGYNYYICGHPYPASVVFSASGTTCFLTDVFSRSLNKESPAQPQLYNGLMILLEFLASFNFGLT